jgi:hypothetical protein
MIGVLAVRHGVVNVQHPQTVGIINMNPFQVIAFTWRSFIQSRRLQRQESSAGLLEGTWYESEEERYADEVGELIAHDLERVKIDTKRRKLIFKKNDRLDLHKTLKRLQSTHRDVDWQVLESELLYWVEQNSEPEGDGLGFTQEQMDRHNQMVESWFNDYHREAAERPQTA